MRTPHDVVNVVLSILDSDSVVSNTAPEGNMHIFA
jgi:hypothetical protein